MTLAALLPDLAPETIARLETFCDLLLDENTRVNLTAITERGAMYTKHVVDSLAAAPYLPRGARVVDIGCGAGLPSLVLKIVRPDLRFLLIDSVRKKIDFVVRTIAALGLDGIEARHARIEEVPKRDFDACVARAVAPLGILCEYALPLLRVGAPLIAFKATNAEDEIAAAGHALAVLGGKVGAVVPYDIGGDATRKLVFVEKLRPTPPQYPRPRNLPRTKPL